MSNRESFDHGIYLDALSEDLDGKIDPDAYSFFCDSKSYDLWSDYSLHDSWIIGIDADYDTEELQITYLTAFGHIVRISYDCREQPAPELHFSPFALWGARDIVLHRVVVDGDELRHELLFPDDNLTTIYFRQAKVEKIAKESDPEKSSQEE